MASISAPRHSPPFERPDMSDLKIVLIGKNGSENSRVANTILGTEAFNREAASHSQHLSVRISVKVEERHVSVINTHLLQPYLSQHLITQRVRECVSLSAPGPHVFVLVLQSKNFSDNDRHRVKYVLKLFSEQAMKHTIVLTTDEETHRFMSLPYMTTNNAIHGLIEECGGGHLQFDTVNPGWCSELFRRIENTLKKEHKEYLICNTYEDGGGSSVDEDQSRSGASVRDVKKKKVSGLKKSTKTASDGRDLFTIKMSDPTTLFEIGGRGGSPFSFTGVNNGASLEKIWVWVGQSQVKAVKVWLSDGRSEIFGQPSGSHQEYVFTPGECFTSLSLWGNGEGTRLGAIKFKTNKGGEFFSKMTSRGLKQEYPMDVGSGFCLGVVGRAGADIDSMGFTFLNAVQSAVLTNVNYPTLHQLIPQVTVEEIKSVTYSNNSSVSQNQKIESSKKVIKTSSWSMSQSLTAALSVEVKAGIPKLGEVSTGFSVSVGVQNTYNNEHTDEKNETLSTSVDVPPREKVEVNITIGRATFDLPYTGTVKITCKNGSVLQYETKGKYKGVSYTDIKVKTNECRDVRTDCDYDTQMISRSEFKRWSSLEKARPRGVVGPTFPTLRRPKPTNLHPLDVDPTLPPESLFWSEGLLASPIPLFHQGSSSAGSEPEPSFRPVFCFSKVVRK